MKLNICKGVACVALAALCSATLAAQNTYSGYFLDNYQYRYQMNPAFSNEKAFVSMPVLGNLNVGLRGNLNLSDVIYTSNGRTVLFTNPNISTEEVMKNISTQNKLTTDIKIDILNVGFKAFGGYNTVGINSRVKVGAMIPGALFSLAKEGVANKTYDITDMRVNAMAYAEFALNHSHKINKHLSIGATLKFLVGAGSVDAYFNNASLQLGENNWIATTNADVYASVGGFAFEHKINETTGKEYVSGGNLDDGYRPQGYGAAVDLGAEYRWNNFSFSASVLDLGFMNWGKTKYASTNGDRTLETDAFAFNANGDASNSFSSEWDRLKDNVDELYQLTDNGEISSRNKMLAATVNAGIDYRLPIRTNVHFGLLNSTCINGPFTWTQFRLSGNCAPTKWFSVDVNGAYGTYGVDLGCMLNFCFTGFNLYCGMDHFLGKLSKQGVPLSSNAAFNIGINFPL